MSSKIKYEYNYFDEIDTESKAYFLGLLISNGTIEIDRSVVQLVVSESQHMILEIFRYALFGDNEAKGLKISPNGTNKGYRIRICNEHMVDSLKVHGLLGTKYQRHPSDKIPNTLLKHYLRGLIDGGGCLISEEKGIRKSLVVIGSISVLSFIQQILYTCLGVIPKKIYKVKNGYRIKYSARKDVAVILSWLYVDANIYMLGHNWNG